MIISVIKLNFLILLSCSFFSVQCQEKNIQKENNKSTIVSDSILIKEIYQSNIDKYLIGKWFIPHCAYINIEFYTNGTFVFNDFNSKKEEMEVLQGIFIFNLKNNKLILKYNDRPYQIFNFRKGKGEDDNYYITKGKNYYFVKSDFD